MYSIIVLINDQFIQQYNYLHIVEATEKYKELIESYTRLTECLLAKYVDVELYIDNVCRQKLHVTY